MRIPYCQFCEATFTEHDPVVRAHVGHMCWGSFDPTALYCDPVVVGGEPMETVFHGSCWQDGPQREEAADLMQTPYYPEAADQPYCPVCEEDLTAGDTVYVIQKGVLEHMEFCIRDMCRIPDGDGYVAITTMYVHKKCVQPAAARYLPGEGVQDVQWEEVEEDEDEVCWEDIY